jgi:hypothetical protein
MNVFAVEVENGGVGTEAASYSAVNEEITMNATAVTDPTPVSAPALSWSVPQSPAMARAGEHPVVALDDMTLDLSFADHFLEQEYAAASAAAAAVPSSSDSIQQVPSPPRPFVTAKTAAARFLTRMATTPSSSLGPPKKRARYAAMASREAASKMESSSPRDATLSANTTPPRKANADLRLDTPQSLAEYALQIPNVALMPDHQVPNSCRVIWERLWQRRGVGLTVDRETLSSPSLPPADVSTPPKGTLHEPTTPSVHTGAPDLNATELYHDPARWRQDALPLLSNNSPLATDFDAVAHAAALKSAPARYWRQFRILHTLVRMRLAAGTWRSAIILVHSALRQAYQPALVDSSTSWHKGLDSEHLQNQVAGLWCLYAHVCLEVSDLVETGTGIQTGEDATNKIVLAWRNHAQKILAAAQTCRLVRGHPWIYLARSRLAPQDRLGLPASPSLSPKSSFSGKHAGARAAQICRVGIEQAAGGKSLGAPRGMAWYEEDVSQLTLTRLPFAATREDLVTIEEFAESIRTIQDLHKQSWTSPVDSEMDDLASSEFQSSNVQNSMFQEGVVALCLESDRLAKRSTNDAVGARASLSAHSEAEDTVHGLFPWGNLKHYSIGNALPM